MALAINGKPECAACGGTPEMAITSPGRTEAITVCLECAKQIAADYDMPGLAEQAAELEALKGKVATK